MATVTQVLGGAGDLVRYELDYDNVLLRVLTFRCINNSTQNAFGSIARPDGSKSYEQVLPPGLTEIPIPGNAANRIGVTLIPRGAGVLVDGVEQHFSWPWV